MKMMIALGIAAAAAFATVAAVQKAKSQEIPANVQRVVDNYVADEIRTMAEFTKRDLSGSIRAFCHDVYLSAGGRERCIKNQNAGLTTMKRVYVATRAIVDKSDAHPFEMAIAADVVKCRDENKVRGNTDWGRTATCTRAAVAAAENALEEARIRRSTKG